MLNHFNRQSGGTLLGLIIGLIIGLGIAVAVALTIKNTPLPFTTNQKSGTAEKRVDSATGQPIDPNKPLYGNKAASKEAAQELARKMELEAAGGNQLPGADAPPNAKRESRAPAVDTAAATAGTQKADNADEKFTYFLQAGAFLSQSDAENTKGKLALLGIAANISERRSDTGTLYRVRIGPFSQQETMSRMRGKLSDNGIDVAVVRVPK